MTVGWLAAGCGVGDGVGEGEGVTVGTGIEVAVGTAVGTGDGVTVACGIGDGTPVGVAGFAGVVGTFGTADAVATGRVGSSCGVGVTLGEAHAVAAVRSNTARAKTYEACGLRIRTVRTGMLPDMAIRSPARVATPILERDELTKTVYRSNSGCVTVLEQEMASDAQVDGCCHQRPESGGTKNPTAETSLSRGAVMIPAAWSELVHTTQESGPRRVSDQLKNRSAK